MPGATQGASVRHGHGHNAKVKRVEIEMHGEGGMPAGAGGYTITHHFHQSDRGHYIEPATAVHTSHGAVTEHVHSILKKHGTDCDTQEGQMSGDECEYCAPDNKEKGNRALGSGGTGKKDLGGKKDYA